MATDPHAASISVVIVAWNSREELARTIPPLLAELDEGDELVVVDNASEDDTRSLVAELAPSATIVASDENVGFAAGANAGAEAASGELLVLLNPDAVPQPGFGRAIRRPLGDGRGWAAWQGLVTAEGGAVINTTGGVLHFTGVAWAGGAGEPVPATPEPAEVAFISGACLAIRRADWVQLGGFGERYFLYHEDVDLSLRLRLHGRRIGIEPRAVVDHDYEFMSRPEKWRHLERNRWATILRDYPAPLLALVTPALLATELALIPISIAGGWGQREMEREPRRAARPATDAARTPRDPSRARARGGRVLVLPDCGPRLCIPGTRGGVRAPALGPSGLLGPGSPAAAGAAAARRAEIEHFGPRLGAYVVPDEDRLAARSSR